MVIYAILMTIVAIFLSAKLWLWKKSLSAMTLFCKENFRTPTDDELKKYIEIVMKKRTP